SASKDLNQKLQAYQRNGIPEYVVFRTRQKQVDWFLFREGKYVPLAPSADGLLRSEIFPGLWLDPEALLNGDLARVFAVLQQGLASPEHAAFVEKLRQNAAEIAGAKS
ncbi:MAG TPA: Uma2 family endonuclease, partial [Isosphaeraceae bacterium]|nr:Uma2 family endonuclease [Isosphaeraceae bacterium]